LKEEALRYRLSGDTLDNSLSYTTTLQGLNKGKHLEKTYYEGKLYVKDYRFNSVHLEHGIIYWIACADDYYKYHS